MGEDRQQRGNHHRADAHRVDVVEVRALEFDVLRRQPQGLVDHQIRDHRADPGGGDIGVEPEHLVDDIEHPQLHQHQRNRHIEHQPHHAAGMTVGDPGEEVRPGQGAGVGIGQVDLHLRDEHEQHHRAQRPFRRGEHITERHQVHLRRFGGTLHGDFVLQGEKGQEGAGGHFQGAGDDPAGAGAEQGGPPAFAVSRGFLRQKAQVVDLFADLRHQRKSHGTGRAKLQQIEVTTAGAAAQETGPVAEGLGILRQYEQVGQHQQRQPQRLGPELQAADQRHPVGHQRDHQHRADHIGEGQWDMEVQLQGQRHDRRFQGEKQEGEAGVDQRGDGRADIAEAGAAGQQVHVDAVAGGVVADGQAGEEDHQAHRENRPEGVGEPITQGQHSADRLQGEERHRAQGGVGDAQLRPLAKGFRRVAQGVVLHGLVGDPAVVVAADLGDALGAGW